MKPKTAKVPPVFISSETVGLTFEEETIPTSPLFGSLKSCNLVFEGRYCF